MTAHGHFHVLLHVFLQGSVTSLAEHRDVQVALTVPTHSQAPFCCNRIPCVGRCSVRLQVSSHPGMPTNQTENSSIVRNAKLLIPPNVGFVAAPFFFFGQTPPFSISLIKLSQSKNTLCPKEYRQWSGNMSCPGLLWVSSRNPMSHRVPVSTPLHTVLSPTSHSVL